MVDPDRMMDEKDCLHFGRRPRDWKVSRKDAHAMLIKGGFVRQAHAGLFHFLPLGLRVQEKIERLLDKHMTKIGASKVSLSTFSSEDLWRKSGRLSGNRSELFALQDRKKTPYLLSPTHEEEITCLVGSIVNSYKELPLRLYQITRKYRDEPRPRQGLLRTREFLMKDLYTFDSSVEHALKTYETVQKAYSAFFDEFKLPYLRAQAISGDIGGDLSHEYHLPLLKGEDSVITCTSCTYVVNEEYESGSGKSLTDSSSFESRRSLNDMPAGDYAFLEDHYNSLDDRWQAVCKVWHGKTKDGNVLVEAFFPRRVEITTPSGTFPRETQVNPCALKNTVEDLDLGNPISSEGFNKIIEQRARKFGASRSTSTEGPEWPRSVRLFDHRLPSTFRRNCRSSLSFSEYTSQDRKGQLLDLIRSEPGDPCPNPECAHGTLKFQTAVELGHTFHLGTRYSAPLEATFTSADPSQKSRPDTNLELRSRFKDPSSEPTSNAQVSLSSPSQNSPPIQMGCHGIGVSRMIAAVAESLVDAKGLNWPRVMAPFEAVIIPTRGLDTDAMGLYDLLAENSGVDAILDDRDKELGWKLKDADLIGYPVMVILGRRWRVERVCEVQCRRLDGWREDVPERELKGVVKGLLDRL